MKMSREEKAALKQRLLAKLQEATSCSRRDGIAVERAPDELDAIQQANERELTLSAIERDAVLATQVRLALQRLRTGEYGICSRCGEDIGLRRLSALPWAKRV
jgi:DnaK suppressor protein